MFVWWIIKIEDLLRNCKCSMCCSSFQNCYHRFVWSVTYSVRSLQPCFYKFWDHPLKCTISKDRANYLFMLYFILLQSYMLANNFHYNSKVLDLGITSYPFVWWLLDHCEVGCLYDLHFLALIIVKWAAFMIFIF